MYINLNSPEVASYYHITQMVVFCVMSMLSFITLTHFESYSTWFKHIRNAIVSLLTGLFASMFLSVVIGLANYIFPYIHK